MASDVVAPKKGERREAPAPLIPVTIAKAIIDIQKTLKPMLKSAENDAFGSSYVPLEEVTEKAHEILTAHGIGVMQPPTTDEHGHAALETILFTGSGQFFSRTTKLALSKVDPQSHGSAITYTRRYALMATLGLTGKGEDDDGNRASGVQAPPTEEQIRELKMLMVLLSYGQENLSKVINSIRTRDAAGIALIKYRDLVSQKQKQLDVEPDADDGGELPAEPEEPKEVSPTSLEGFQRRIKALGLAGPEYERKIIVAATKAYSLDKVMEKEDRIKNLNDFLITLESGVHALEPEYYKVTDEPRTVEVNVA